MSPTVLFAPFNKLAALVDQTETPDLHIGVQPFVDKRPGHRIPYGYGANIDAMEIAARAGNIEFRIGAQPELGTIVVIPVAFRYRRRPDRQILILEFRRGYC